MTTWKSLLEAKTAASKVCSKCGIEKSASEFTPRADRPVGLYPSCKACKRVSKKATGIERRKRDSVKFWSQRAVSLARDRSRTNKSSVSVTWEEVSEKIKASNLCCVYCDKVLNFLADMSGRTNSPSLDRINPKLGYSPANTTVCCYRCNAIKGNATPEELKKIADRVERLLT